MIEKICNRCKELKDINNFSKNKRSKDGYCNRCKSCDKLYSDKNKEKIKIHNKAYYENNFDKLRENQRKYKENNREELIKYYKEYYKHNVDRNSSVRANVAKKRVSGINLEEKDFNEIKSFYADCPDGYHVDHIIPLALGGTHTLDNLQHLEAWLNMKKNDKHPDDWDDPRPIKCRA